MSYKRSGNKWSVNEILTLQREHELLKLSVQEMSIRHKRSEEAIMYKLDFEGFIDSWSDVKGFDLDRFQNQKGLNTSDLIVANEEDEEDQHGGDDNDSEYVVDEDDDEDEDEDDLLDKNTYEDKVTTLSDRVWSLETSVSQIGSTVKQIFDILTLNKLNKNSNSLNME